MLMVMGERVEEVLDSCLKQFSFINNGVFFVIQDMMLSLEIWYSIIMQFMRLIWLNIVYICVHLYDFMRKECGGSIFPSGLPGHMAAGGLDFVAWIWLLPCSSDAKYKHIVLYIHNMMCIGIFNLLVCGFGLQNKLGHETIWFLNLRKNSSSVMWS